MQTYTYIQTYLRASEVFGTPFFFGVTLTEQITKIIIKNGVFLILKELWG